jgi:hypothetical protein
MFTRPSALSLKRCKTVRDHFANFVPNSLQGTRGFANLGVDFRLSQPAFQTLHFLRAFTDDVVKMLYILDTVAWVSQEIGKYLGGARSQIAAFLQCAEPIGRHVRLPTLPRALRRRKENKETGQWQAVQSLSALRGLISIPRAWSLVLLGNRQRTEVSVTDSICNDRFFTPCCSPALLLR